MPRPSPWTPELERQLRASYLAGNTARAFAARYGLRLAQVRMRARKLGLIQTRGPEQDRRRELRMLRPWPPPDTQFTDALTTDTGLARLPGPEPSFSPSTSAAALCTQHPLAKG